MSSITLSNTWNTVDSVDGNTKFTSIAMSTTGQYALTNSTFTTKYCSDGANTWTPLSTITVANQTYNSFGITGVSMEWYPQQQAMSATGQYIVLAAYDTYPETTKGLVYYSSNYGATFALSTGLPASAKFRAPSMSSSGQYVVVFDVQSATPVPMYYSTNYGASFVSAGNIGSQNYMNGSCISDDGKTVVATVSAVSATTTKSVYIGTYTTSWAWTPVNPSGTYNAAYLCAANSTASTIYVGIASNGLYKSTNTGATWTKIDGTLGLPSGYGTSGGGWSVAMTKDGTKILATKNVVSDTTGGVYLSSDSGASFSLITGLPSYNTRWWPLAISTDGRYMSAGMGFDPSSNSPIYNSFDSGNTWTAYSDGLSTNSLCIQNKVLLATTGTYSATTTTVSNVYIANLLPITASTLSASGQYAVGYIYGENLYYSTNSGQTWTVATTQPVSTLRRWSAISTDATGQYAVLCENSGNLFYSADYGNTWTQSTGVSGQSFTDIAIAGNNAIACAYGGSIYYSSNSGQSWLASAQSASTWQSVAISGVSSVTGNSALISDMSAVYYSSNSGQSWTTSNLVIPGIATTNNQISVSISDVSGASGTYASGAYALASLYNGSIYYSNNSGQTWTSYNNKNIWSSVQISRDSTYALAIAGNQLYASSVAYYNSANGMNLPSFPTPALHYPFNDGDSNVTNQLTDWSSGTPVYNGSLNNAYINKTINNTGLSVLPPNTNTVDFGPIVRDVSFGTYVFQKSITSVSFSRDQTRMVFCTYDQSGQVFYSTRASNVAQWATPIALTTALNYNWYIPTALMLDGSRGAAAVGYSHSAGIYIFTWNGTGYGNWKQTLDTGTYDCKGLAITEDGSTLIACANSSIYRATWNSAVSNYSVFTTDITHDGQTLQGLCVSANGERIVYGNITNNSWYVSYWNGTSYAPGQAIRNIGVNPRQPRLSYDSSLLFLSYSVNPNFNVEYCRLNTVTNEYDTFVPVSQDLLSCSWDVHAMHYIDNVNPSNPKVTNGILYVYPTWTGGPLVELPVTYTNAVTSYVASGIPVQPTKNITLGPVTIDLSMGTYVFPSDLISFALSRDQTRMVFATYAPAGKVFYTTRTSNTALWSTPTAFPDATNSNYWIDTALTADGSRGVACVGWGTSSNSYVYSYSWTGSGYGNWTQTLDTTQRDYRGISITADGSRMVACSGSSIYRATWDISNSKYSVFTQDILVPGSVQVQGVGVSSNGDRIVYGEQTNNNWYLAYWNGTSYSAGTVIRNAGYHPRMPRFSFDSSLLFLSYESNPNFSVEYCKWNTATNAYDIFVQVPTNVLPSTWNVHGLYYIDNKTSSNVTTGILYVYSHGLGGGIRELPVITTSTYLAKSTYNSAGMITDTPRTNVIVAGTLSASYTAVGTYTFPSKLIAVAVSRDQTRMIFATNIVSTGQVYYTTRVSASLAWSTPTIVAGSSAANYSMVALSADGSRGAACVGWVAPAPGYVYSYTWTGSGYGNWTQTLDTTQRDYRGLSMTADGSRLLACSGSSIYRATWDSTASKYSAFTQELTISTDVIQGIGVSANGDRIVYGDTTNNYWYISFWNGSSYAVNGINGGAFHSVGYAPRTPRFSFDSSLLFLSYLGNPNFSVEYGKWNPDTKTYDNFTYISKNLIPASLDTHGLYYVDNISNSNVTNGTLYVAPVNLAVGIVYELPITISYSATKTAFHPSGVGALEFPKNVMTIGTLYNISTSYNAFIGIAVSQDNCRLVACQYYGTVLYSIRATSTDAFGTFTQVAGSPTSTATSDKGNYCRVALSADGNRGVTCFGFNATPLNTTTPYTYMFTWTGAGYGKWTQTLDTVPRDYYGLAMTPDGSRIVASTYQAVYFANWNGTNYNAYTQTLQTTGGLAGFIGVGVSMNADRIVYGCGNNWYISFWNGTNYKNGTSFRTASNGSTRTAVLSADSSILFLSYTRTNTSYSLEYGKYNPYSNTYDSFTAVPTATVPANLNLHAICYVDGSITNTPNTGYLYYATSTVNMFNVTYTTTQTKQYANLITSNLSTVQTITSPITSCISIVVSKDQMKMLIVHYTANNIYYATRTTLGLSTSGVYTYSDWSSFTQVPGSLSNQIYYKVAITSDGQRGVTCINNGLVYFFTWTGGAPSGWTQTLDSTSRLYQGLSLTADGSKLVVCTTNGYIGVSTWNGSNYPAFTQVTSDSGNYVGIAVSSNGDRIAYSEVTNNNWYLSFWNGTTYANRTIFRTSTTRINTAAFNSDSSILFLSYGGSNASASVEYGIYTNGLYDGFTPIPASVIPGSLNVHGLFYADNNNGQSGNLYVGVYSSSVFYIAPFNALPTNAGTLTQSAITGTDTSNNKNLDIAVSNDELKAVVAGFQSGLYYSTRTHKFAPWSAFTQVSGSLASPQNYYRVSSTFDGIRWVTCIQGGLVYTFTWASTSGATPTGWLQTLDATTRGYTGLRLSADGSRLVACTDAYVYFATWNGTNYTAFTQTLQTTDSFMGLAISANGDRIVYSSKNTNMWYISFWNGTSTNYANGTVFRKYTSGNSRNAFFSDDSSILFLGYNSNPKGSIEYGYYNGSQTVYDNFSFIPASLLPANLTASGYTIDGICFKNNSLYVVVFGSATIYCVPLFPEYPRPYITGNNGLTYACWFKSNNSSLYSRIFDFGNGADSDNILIAIFNSNGLIIATRRGGSGAGPDLLWPFPINDNNWYHIAFSLSYVDATSPTSNMVVYLNGTVILNTSQHYYPVSIMRTCNFIGRSNWVDPQFYGAIKDFRAYNSTLTASQIQNIYYSTPIVQNQLDRTKTPICLTLPTAVNVATTTWGLATTNMGTNLSYFYWNSTNGSIGETINYANPINYSYTYNNTTGLTNVRLYVICDDAIKFRINNTDTTITGTTGWNLTTVTATTVNINSGNNKFDFYCLNTGGGAMFAAYVTDSAGNYLFSTTSNHSGWTSSLTGYFINSEPAVNVMISSWDMTKTSLTSTVTRLTSFLNLYDMSFQRQSTNVSPFLDSKYTYGSTATTTGTDLNTLMFTG